MSYCRGSSYQPPQRFHLRLRSTTLVKDLAPVSSRNRVWDETKCDFRMLVKEDFRKRRKLYQHRAPTRSRNCSSHLPSRHRVPSQVKVFDNYRSVILIFTRDSIPFHRICILRLLLMVVISRLATTQRRIYHYPNAGASWA